MIVSLIWNALYRKSDKFLIIEWLAEASSIEAFSIEAFSTEAFSIEAFSIEAFSIEAFSKLSLKQPGCLQNLGGIDCFLMSSNTEQERERTWRMS